jgi:hypothetical protein
LSRGCSLCLPLMTGCNLAELDKVHNLGSRVSIHMSIELNRLQPVTLGASDSLPRLRRADRMYLVSSYKYLHRVL